MAARRVLVLGATGTIGRAVIKALVQEGHRPVAVVRAGTVTDDLAAEAELIIADMSGSAPFSDMVHSAHVDAIVSCLASRSGVPADAWAIDYRANLMALSAAQQSGLRHFILVSAICVQRPRLAFQHAKLAFEAALADSGLRYSIVRPTAFFKSLSGQIERVRSGKPFLLFGDGELTACKPISDGDLAHYVVGCFGDPQRWNRILPIGGPGPAITPRAQGEALFALLGQEPRFRSVSPGLLRGAAGVLSLLPGMAAKAELARIGHYYATESMLLFDHRTGCYDAGATPETGTETLFDHYRRVVTQDAAFARVDTQLF